MDFVHLRHRLARELHGGVAHHQAQRNLASRHGFYSSSPTSNTSATTWTSACSRFRVRGDVVDAQPAYEEIATRVEFFGDQIDSIKEFDPLTGEVLAVREELTVFPASHYVTPAHKMNTALTLIEEESVLQACVKEV